MKTFKHIIGYIGVSFLFLGILSYRPISLFGFTMAGVCYFLIQIGVCIFLVLLLLFFTWLIAAE